MTDVELEAGLRISLALEQVADEHQLHGAGASFFSLLEADAASLPFLVLICINTYYNVAAISDGVSGRLHDGHTRSGLSSCSRPDRAPKERNRFAAWPFWRSAAPPTDDDASDIDFR